VVVASIPLLFRHVTTFVIASVGETENLATGFALEPRQVGVGFAVRALVFFLGNVSIVDNKANVAPRSCALNFIRDNARATVFLVLVEEDLSYHGLALSKSLQCRS
jgi:hypothetical protein